MFIASNPHQHIGRVVGTGHCVPFVQTAAGAPLTAHWRRGEKVRGADIARGTVIATFNDAGRYSNSIDGSSHAAILLAQNSDGLLVLDQWLNRPVGERVIRFKNGEGPAANDGCRFFVVVTA